MVGYNEDMSQDPEYNDLLYVRWKWRWYARFTFILTIIAVLLCLLVIAFVWGNSRKVVINCGSFDSQVRAMEYIKTHPVYKYRLDTNQNGIPCQHLPVW